MRLGSFVRRIRGPGLFPFGRCLFLTYLSFWLCNPSFAGPSATGSRRLSEAESAALPRTYLSSRVHRMGGIRLGVTNNGFIGSAIDTCLGLYGNDLILSSFEFPAGSQLEYIYGGALWIGAVQGRDTLVSTAMDGWRGSNELWAGEYPSGRIEERTTLRVLPGLPGTACPDVYHSDDAVSEQDFVTTYFDTLVYPGYTGQDPIDGRGHMPLGLEIHQESYSWSFSTAQGFIILDFGVKNISEDVLKELYIGLYMDHDILHVSNPEGRLDDITGFLHTIPDQATGRFLDTVNVPWIADNDGDPLEAQFVHTSPTGVVGVRVLRAPTPDLNFSFNWWVSNQETSKDWGPNKRNSQVVYIPGNLGTPMGDRAKYQVMSNREFDYEQVESAIDHTAAGWLPPVNNASLALDLADGFDTRYLLSFGPFNVPPDSVLPLTFAILAAQDFHTEPENFAKYFNSYDPEPYYSHLSFENLGFVARWSGWVYDVPGLDSDGDGYRGKFRVHGTDTAYYEGDGVPDFRNPPPPPSPSLRFAVSAGRISLQWNGERSETEPDPFSDLVDFEAYRVYMSRTGRWDDFAFVAQRDKVDYSRVRWYPAAGRWRVKDPPLTLDSLKTLYDALSDSLHGYPFHPDSFQTALIDRALREIILDQRDPSKLDTNYYCFVPYEANLMADDQALAGAIDLGLNVTGVIHRLYPNEDKDLVRYRPDGSPFRPYYEYEFVLDELQVAEPIFLAVSTLDFGNPQVGLPPSESPPLANAIEIWPVNSAEVLQSTHAPPGVYPNPYRLIDSYNDAGWENRRGVEPDAERARQVTFYNVPETCIVSIWSLDGDLVRRLEHRSPSSSSNATVVIWDLITRNTQAVKTGLYIWSVESRFGTNVGKLVIIK